MNWEIHCRIKVSRLAKTYLLLCLSAKTIAVYNSMSMYERRSAVCCPVWTIAVKYVTICLCTNGVQQYAVPCGPLLCSTQQYVCTNGVQQYVAQLLGGT